MVQARGVLADDNVCRSGTQRPTEACSCSRHDGIGRTTGVIRATQRRERSINGSTITGLGVTGRAQTRANGTLGTIGRLPESTSKIDRREQRRAARREENRADILDAAETVFGEDGIQNGSIRRIAELSGFSPAAIYLFFDDKQHLLSETLTRRADEWNSTIRVVAANDRDPLDTLHEMIDVSVDFFDARPQFRLLLRHIRGGPAVTGPVLAEFADHVNARYFEFVTQIGKIVAAGQATGSIRSGGERSLAHLYSVLVNEYILMAASKDEFGVGRLTQAEFHAFVDGALGAPSRPRKR